MSLPAVSRRQLMTILAVAAPTVAQQPAPPPRSPVPPQGVPAPPPPALSPEARQQKADADIRKASEALRDIKIPIELEPAFTFSALTLS